MNWRLAQVNIGAAKFAYDDPRFTAFVENLDRINVLAEQSPGFIWRYAQNDEYEAGRDDSLLFNMSMWVSRDALMNYVYHSDHVHVLRKRAEWFVNQDRPILALWWQPAGTIPTVHESRHRLDRLAQAGPTEDAFTFRNFFDEPQAAATAHG